MQTLLSATSTLARNPEASPLEPVDCKIAENTLVRFFGFRESARVSAARDVPGGDRPPLLSTLPCSNYTYVDLYIQEDNSTCFWSACIIVGIAAVV